MIAVAAHGPCVRAFESPEHAKLSNDAFAVAAAKTGREYPEVFEAIEPGHVVYGFEKGFEWDPGDKPGAKETIKKLKNDILEANKAETPAGYGVMTYGTFVMLADYYNDPLVQFRVWGDSDELPRGPEGLSREFLEYLPSNWRAMLQASHLNNAHFQEGALKTYWWWHRMAVMIAAHEHNLFSALIVNAFADHFLEDYFAPGHVQTFRQDLHDVAARGIHDYYNLVGADYEITDWPKLAPFAAVVHTDVGGDLEKRVEALERAIKSGTTRMRIYGDNHIDDEPLQYPFMVLVVARSVSDVLESFASGNVVNTYCSITWKSRRVPDERHYNLIERTFGLHGYRVEPPEAAIPVGRYDLEKPSEIAYSQIFGLTADFQSLLTHHDSHSRGILHLEINPLGYPPRGNFLRTASGELATGGWQMALGIGYAGVFGDGYVGHGPELRIGFPIAKLDSQATFGGGVRNYIGRGRDVWRPNAGATFEMGFGLVFARVGVSYDSAITRGGDVVEGPAFLGGVTAMAPYSLLRDELISLRRCVLSRFHDS